MNRKVWIIVSSFLFSSIGNSAPLVERVGAYEINWSISKVRFYGVGKFKDGDENYRAVGQRAWAKGLKLAEHNIPILLSDKLGAVDRQSQAKISQLADMTLSVTSTYYGDDRVKVLLETPIQKLTPQLVHNGPAPSVASVAENSGVIINLPKNVKPAAFTRILDENGRELVSAKDMAAAAHGGAPLIKWFRDEADKSAMIDTGMATIDGTSTERGVVRVRASDWKPIYAAAIMNGKAAFVVK